MQSFKELKNLLSFKFYIAITINIIIITKFFTAFWKNKLEEKYRLVGIIIPFARK